MKNFFCNVAMVLVLILGLNNKILAQCDINLSCADDVFVSIDPPVFDANTLSVSFNNIEIGSFSCDESTYTSGMAFYTYQLLPDGSRIDQCTVLDEAPFNVVGNVALNFGQSSFCGVTIPIGTIELPRSEGFEACDGALLQAEAVLYVTEQTDVDVNTSSIYSQLPSSQYVVIDLGTVEININNEFPGNGQPLTTAKLRDFNSASEGPQTLTCGQNVELYIEGLSRLANCTPYDDISTGITSELVNEFYYQINDGEPVIIIDESTGAKGGQLTGPDSALNGLCYAGVLNIDAPYVLDYSVLPSDLCEGSEILFTLKTTDLFTNQTAEDTYSVIYTGSCTICESEGCTNACATNYDPEATIDDGSCALPAQPVIACYETTTFDDITCEWSVTGERPFEPTDLACYEVAIFDENICDWVSNGEQPAEPTDIFCYETTTFDEAICNWVVTGEQPAQPTGLACYESVGAFDNVTCAWQILGEQPPVDDGCDITTDTFDDATCMAVNTPDCPANTSFNSVDCSCDDDVIPGCTDMCASNYNQDANQDDGSCILPEEPAIACYETASFSTTTCAWEVTGTQPEQPMVACYETVMFDDFACAWNVTGEQPPIPADLACYESVGPFDDVTCAWQILGEQPPVDDGCDLTTDSFDETTCMVVNTPNCPVGFVLDIMACECTTIIVDGCTDMCDPNYNPSSTNDDLCEGYDTVCDDGDDCTIDFYDSDICICQNLLPPTTQGCECSPVPNCPGCTNACAINFDPYAQSDDGSCEFQNIDDGCDLTIDSFEPNSCEVIHTADCPDGTIFNSEDCLCENVLGCIPPVAGTIDCE